MKQQYSIPLKHVVESLALEVVHPARDYEAQKVISYNVARPSLQLVGFYNYFDSERILLWGKAETAFLAALNPVMQTEVVYTLFSKRNPALICCNGMYPDKLLKTAAEKYDVTLLYTREDTSEMMSDLIYTLRTALAPRQTMHGVMVQVHGEGLLITGESGIGKSEVALELIKRGHRLVADDAVEVRRMNRTRLEGRAPKMIRYLMELQGLGLIDVRRIYGVGSVLPTARIDLMVNFVRWEQKSNSDRIGLEDEEAEILGVKLPLVTIPVAPARNLAIILEVAAMNNRQKKLGHNTAQEFLKRHDQNIDNGGDCEEDSFIW